MGRCPISHIGTGHPGGSRAGGPDVKKEFIGGAGTGPGRSSPPGELVCLSSLSEQFEQFSAGCGAGRFVSKTMETNKCGAM